jgi:hypothetical protein
MNDAMVVNLALLIPDTGHEQLDQRLDQLDQQYGGQLQIRCVGPLPVYSFATLELQMPSFAEVDAARQSLNLYEQTSYSKLKHAFRSFVAKNHPDLNQQDEQAAARVDQMTQAYRLLTAIAQEQRPALDAADWSCNFDRSTIDQTVLLKLTRQEATAQPE